MPSPLSFTFQRPAPLLSTPLHIKHYRLTPNVNPQLPSVIHNCFSSLHDPSLTYHCDSFRFSIQYNSSFSQYFHAHLLESDRGVLSSSSSSPFSTHLELASNQYSRLSSKQDVNVNNIEFNEPNYFQNNYSGFTRNLLMEAQTLASGQNLMKGSYLNLNEGYYMFNECQILDDFPISFVHWS